MDSVGNLLGKYKPDEPDEIGAVKQYIHDTFGEKASIALQNGALVITVGSASLANALRLRLPALQQAARTTKRIIFRIG